MAAYLRFSLQRKYQVVSDLVLNNLLNDIEKKYSRQSRPDLIFVTGDISFSGKKAEFDIAQDFIDRLLEVTLSKKIIYFLYQEITILKDVKKMLS